MELVYIILIPLLMVMAISLGILAWFRAHRRRRRRQQEQSVGQDNSHMTDEEFQAHIAQESRRTLAAQRASRGGQQGALQPQAFPEIEGYYAPEAPPGAAQGAVESDASRQLRGYYEPEPNQRALPPAAGTRPVFG